MKRNAYNIFNYVKRHEEDYITASDIAEALGLTRKSVDCTITMAFQKVGLMKREAAEIEIEREDGKIEVKPVKIIQLTDEGREYPIDEQPIED
jgi:Mn-dependent DtxR family transcriptional regulator